MFKETNFLTANWENLIMANYAVDAKVLADYLPKGVDLDYYNGETYVSLDYCTRNRISFYWRIVNPQL